MITSSRPCLGFTTLFGLHACINGNDDFFGFLGARFFAPVFAASENASFDNKLFLQWLNEILLPLSPDVEDKAGYSSDQSRQWTW